MKYHYIIHLDASHTTLLQSSEKINGFEGFNTEAEARAEAEKESQRYPMPQYHRITIKEIGGTNIATAIGGVLIGTVIAASVGIFIYFFRSIIIGFFIALALMYVAHEWSRK